MASEQTKINLSTPESMPGGPMVGTNISPEIKAYLSAIQESLGEKVESGWLRRQFGDDRIINGLKTIEQSTGVPAQDYIDHSYRYAKINEETLWGKEVWTGHEFGHRLLLDNLEPLGIDPSKVLYYRATQPSSEPRPERYWTSDSLEARRGLEKELGNRARSTIILVATLTQISQNDGLMTDINGDEGSIDLKQLGNKPFDQKEALFQFARERNPMPIGAVTLPRVIPRPPAPEPSQPNDEIDW